MKMDIAAMLGMPVKTFLRRAVIASGTGWGCGRCYHNLKDNPGTTTRFVKYAAVGGCVGGIRGYCLGLWFGRGMLSLFLSQTMAASCATFAFLSIHSALENKKLVLPWHDEKPISEVLITSASGGITIAGLAILSGAPAKSMLTGLSAGLVLGFIGHIVYEKGCQLRLEFLLRHNYSDLMGQLRDAEDYMDEQQYSDPYYTGPVKPTPWTDMARDIWAQFRKKDDVLEENVANME